jgi:hypothetical protein
VCAFVHPKTGEDTLADQNTINRIGGILKNVYSDAIVEQQNLAAVARKLFTKAKGVRLGGDHYEVSIRIGGNRAGVGARNSDDLLPIPLRQQEKKFLVYDRAVFGVIRVFDKDIQNSKDNKQAFINHLDDEVTQVAKDVMKHMNIMTYGDGTGTLTTVSVGTVNVNTFVGAAGTAFGKFGTRYLQLNDQIDIWDPTFTVQRTPVGGVGITNISPSTQTVTTSVNLTLFAGDVVVRANSANKEYIGLQLATDNSSAVTFQGLSRGTYSIIQGNVIDAGGAGLAESYLQQIISLIEMSSGETPDRFLTGNAQWDAYVALGQSLKRYVNTQKLDRGFQELDYNGIPFLKDVDALPADIYALNSEYCQNGVVTPLSWSEEDGSILKWDAGYAAYKAFMREYGNYVWPRPNAIGRVQSLSVANAYVR